MKVNVSLLFLILAFCLLSCSPKSGEEQPTSSAIVDSTRPSTKGFLADCGKYKAEALRMDSILMRQTDIDPASAKKAIVAFTEFARFCDTDTLSPVFLIKTAQVARAINVIPQAKVVLDECIATYPNFRDRPAAIFLLAQLYDEDTYLNDEQEAKKLYQKIIDEYPKSPWASSAKGAILFIGKSDKQIMEELKKKKH
jgi:hypothetical protein